MCLLGANYENVLKNWLRDMHHINISYFWNNKDSKNQLYQ